MATIPKNVSIVEKVLVATLFVSLFFIVNAQNYAFGFIIYTIMGIVEIFLYTSWSKITKKSDLEGLSDKALRNFFIGVGIGIAIIILGSFIPGLGAIGIPNVQSIVGIAARFFVICVFAPIFEVVFFEDLLQDFFNSFLGWNIHISIILQAALGSIFHLSAYGNSLAQSSGSFFSAFLMFIVFGYLVEKQNDDAGAIGMHMTLNIFIGFVKLAVIIALNLGIAHLIF